MQIPQEAAEDLLIPLTQTGSLTGTGFSHDFIEAGYSNPGDAPLSPPELGYAALTSFKKQL